MAQLDLASEQQHAELDCAQMQPYKLLEEELDGFTPDRNLRVVFTTNCRMAFLILTWLPFILLRLRLCIGLWCWACCYLRARRIFESIADSECRCDITDIIRKFDVLIHSRQEFFIDLLV